MALERYIQHSIRMHKNITKKRKVIILCDICDRIVISISFASYVKPSPQNEDILVIPEMEYCQSKRMTIFLGSIYVYKGLLMVSQ